MRPEGALAAGRGRKPALYPQERLYQELAFLAYYLHWSRDALLDLDHRERQRWCREVSAINQKLSGKEEKSFEFR